MKAEGLIQFIKFGVVGVTNTAVDWVVYYVLVNFFLQGEEVLAKAIAFIVAVMNSYLWNTIWTFRKEYQKSVSRGDATAKSALFGRFVIVSLVGWGINVLAFSFAYKYIALEIINSDLVPLVFASGAAIVWNFFANKFWTYKAKN